MAGVWTAEDLKLHRKVAVKLLSSAMRSKPELKERFKAEARAAARLNHPNVVAVYDTGEQDGVPFIVMELLSGRTLADELKKGPMEQDRVLRIARRVLAGLQAAHAVGIVHRDVKPWNILFSLDGETVKVADFGIAKGVEGMDLTRTGTMMGTPAYLSPEQVAGESATASSDLYSLGVVLYEALAGRPPYDAESVIALANKIQNFEPPPLTEARPDIDPGLAAVVEKAMTKRPEDRFRNATEMASALASVGVRASTETSEMANPTMLVPPGSDLPGDRTQVMEATRTAYAPEPVPAGRRGLIFRPGALAVALSIIALLLVAGVVAFQSLTRSGPIPQPTSSPTRLPTNASPLPTPLENSLRDLEDAVRR